MVKCSGLKYCAMVTTISPKNNIVSSSNLSLKCPKLLILLPNFALCIIGRKIPEMFAAMQNSIPTRKPNNKHIANSVITISRIFLALIDSLSTTLFFIA